jgi:hypothetical protein
MESITDYEARDIFYQEGQRLDRLDCGDEVRKHIAIIMRGRAQPAGRKWLAWRAATH